MKILFVFLLILTSSISCSSKDSSGLATASAVLVAAPLTPISKAVVKVDRKLGVYELYKLDEETYAVRNEYGWFTDRSERDPNKKDKRYQSAWIINLKNELKDEEGKIILSENNLDRWFFRDNDISKLIEIPRNPEIPTGEYYISKPGEHFITLRVYGKSQILYLKQN